MAVVSAILMASRLSKPPEDRPMRAIGLTTQWLGAAPIFLAAGLFELMKAWSDGPGLYCESVGGVLIRADHDG